MVEYILRVSHHWVCRREKNELSSEPKFSALLAKVRENLKLKYFNSVTKPMELEWFAVPMMQTSFSLLQSFPSDRLLESRVQFFHFSCIIFVRTQPHARVDKSFKGNIFKKTLVIVSISSDWEKVGTAFLFRLPGFPPHSLLRWISNSLPNINSFHTSLFTFCS